MLLYSYMKTPVLAPSLLSSDFSRLGEALDMIEKNKGSWVHIDVMDGNFVPEITIGQPVIRCMRPLTKLPFDVHLMITNPDERADSFIDAGADYLTFHYEACSNPGKLIDHIHERGVKAGISIKPETSVDVLVPLLEKLDLILVMTVNPGYGGQKIIPECIEKVAYLSNIRRKRNLGYILSVDGGVNEKTAADVIRAGTDVVVSGSSFFAGRLTADDLKRFAE